MSSSELHADPQSLHRYEAIYAHAELELGLAGRGEIERLAELDQRWGELVRDLPAQPPLAAAALLQRARLIHERTRVELERVRGLLLDELADTKRARRAAGGYAGQLARRPRLDRSA
ncbi:MAG: hypothetical protein ACRDJX_03220 [Solirubrobacteraceae bacterium]